MAKSIFEEQWFTWHALAGMRAAIHQTPDIDRHEKTLVAQMLSRFLYTGPQEPLIKEAIDFFSLCNVEKERSFAQIYQDLWVLMMTQHKRGGYFVEFGACDGVELSNTLLLERHFGWTGILAEPNPTWHEKLLAERLCHISTLCVHPVSNEKVAFEAVVERPELSRVQNVVPVDIHEREGNRKNSRTIEVETISLNDLLDRHNAPDEIDYLSIDTEGSELEILRSFNFDRRSIRLMTIEHAGEVKKREAICHLLEARGYRRWFTEFSRWDDWYILSDAPDQAAAGEP